MIVPICPTTAEMVRMACTTMERLGRDNAVCDDALCAAEETGRNSVISANMREGPG